MSDKKSRKKSSPRKREELPERNEKKKRVRVEVEKRLEEERWWLKEVRRLRNWRTYRAFKTTFKTSSSAFDFPKGSIDGTSIQHSLRSIPLTFRLKDFISENPRDRIEVGLPNKQQMGLSSRDRIGKERANKKKEERESRRQQENII
ncbi:hypothetical protein V1477_017231 [Vespula maculifrons]|uniref:Uncharacterized protein n=1 Tax=Vespula maculifrons TaxID=7453 RepID=A0ABD2B5F1_VESMC